MKNLDISRDIYYIKIDQPPYCDQWPHVTRSHWTRAGPTDGSSAHEKGAR